MKKGFIFIALATVLFSTMEIALKRIAGDFNPVQLTATRFLIGGIFLIPFAVAMLKKRGVHISGKDIGFFAVLGLVGIAASMMLYQMAILNEKASVVAAVFSCNPAFVMLFAAIFLREKIHKNNAAAIILEIAGIAIMVNPFQLQGNSYGILFTLLSLILFALYSVFGKRKCAKYGGATVTCFSFLFGAAELLVFILLGHIGGVASFLQANHLEIFANVPLFTGYSAANIGYFLYISIGITGLGFASYFMAMEYTSASTTSVVFFFKPVLATVLAALFLQEMIPVSMVVGIAVMLAGSLAMLLPGFLQKRGQPLTMKAMNGKRA
ncbi:MAG: DMT family transporter [Christensenella sp.]|nr:DMT family transporter [Christensenella sp.]